MVYPRKMRHWKQRWVKDAEFVWSRPTTYGLKQYLTGDDLPEALLKQRTKLRRFWESRRIELKDFEAPDVATGQEHKRELPKGVTVTKLKGPWYLVDTGLDEIKVNGKKARDALLEELRVEAKAEVETPPADEPKADEADETDDFLS